VSPNEWIASRLGLEPWLVEWLSAYGFTQSIEVPVYASALRTRPLTERLALAFSASAITHPLVWFAFPSLLPGHDAYWVMVAAAELFAWSAEAGLLWALRVERPWLWSFAANGSSFGLGLVMRAFVGWP
jgi:hypothetical protein